MVKMRPTLVSIWHKFILIILYKFAFSEGELIKKIIGGKLTSWDAYPFMASIVTRVGGNSIRLCGGTIIDSRWILTAAHCINEVSLQAVTVSIGSTKFAGGDRYSAKRLVIHQDYDEENNDIALIELRTPVTFGSGKKIRLNTGDIPAGTQATLVGWGYTETQQNINNVAPLHSVQLRVVKCQQASLIDVLFPIYSRPSSEKDNYQASRIICTSTMNGKGACVGDSGGPLVVNSKQIGIVSRGTPCATGSPDIYTKVQSYVGWIEDKTKIKFRT